MRHLKKGRKFGRTRDQRRALLRNLLFELIMRERVVTAEAKAKELSPLIEKMVTRARTGTVAARRILAQRLPQSAVAKLVATLAPRFARRPGGYTRIVKLGPRKSDGSRQALIEFIKE